MPNTQEQLDRLNSAVRGITEDLEDFQYATNRKLGLGTAEIKSAIANGSRLELGSGNSVMKFSEDGLWLGHQTFASAPFGVTMAGVLTASGLTITDGSVGGFTISASTLTAGTTNIILDSTARSISINDATFGNSGIQLQHNAGTPRGYIGNGSNRFLNFDGTNLSWQGVNTQLTTGGTFTAAVVDNIQGSSVDFGDIVGDGSDGNVTISGATSLTADMFYNDLTVNDTLTTDGFRIFVKGAFTGSGTIACNGSVGTVGNNSVFQGGTNPGGAGGASGDDGGTLDSGVDGAAGGTGGDYGASAAGGVGVTGIAATYSFDGNNGTAGGRGGDAGTNGGGLGAAASTGGTRTLGAILPDDILIAPYNILSTGGADVIQGNAGAAGGSGGGGIGAGNYSGASGGGGGGCGGTIFISAKTVTFDGTFSTTGGTGGAGGAGFDTGNASNNPGGGGGGAGGGGGLNVLFYLSKTGVITKTVTVGTGGAAGSHSSDQTSPAAGTNGPAGISKEIQIDFL